MSHAKMLSGGARRRNSQKGVERQLRQILCCFIHSHVGGKLPKGSRKEGGVEFDDAFFMVFGGETPKRE